MERKDAADGRSTFVRRIAAGARLRVLGCSAPSVDSSASEAAAADNFEAKFTAPSPTPANFGLKFAGRRALLSSGASNPVAPGSPFQPRTRFTLALLVGICVSAAFLAPRLTDTAAADSPAPGQGLLPDDRAWELVSPPDKNGGEVFGLSARTRAALSGEAVQFGSLQAFADARGTGVAVEYIAQRSTDPSPANNGWSTHAITPLQNRQSKGTAAGLLEPKYEGYLSDDLSTGVFRATSPLTEDPWVENAINLYRRDDLTTPGAGTFELVTACPRCAETSTPTSPFFFPQGQWFTGASDDFTHLVFDSPLQLTTNAPASTSQFKLYEWSDGEVRLAGILPTGAAAPRSISARRSGNSLRNITNSYEPISADGSQIVFTVPASNSAQTGSREGDLYLRSNGRSTVQLNTSERTIAEPAAPARFWHVSDDGTRVLFTSTEALTDNAPPDTLPKLYQWQRQDHDELQTLTIDASNGTFSLSFHGQTTSDLSFDISADDLETALEDLSTIKTGNVSVTGGPGGPGGTAPYEIAFTGDFAGANVAELTVDESSLAGGTAAVGTTNPVENLEFLSADSEPDDGIGGTTEGVLGASDDGRYVYFASDQQLVDGAPTFSDRRLYLSHDGEITHIGALANWGSDQDETVLGAASALSPTHVRITPDGRQLIFRSSSGAGLLSARGGTDYEQNGFGQLYLFSAGDNSLVCVSCRPSGAPSTTPARVESVTAKGSALIDNYRSRAISDDGRYVFFSTAERLVAEDTNGPCPEPGSSRDNSNCADVYAYDAVDGRVSLISSGQGTSSPAVFLDASADGKDVFFITREQLSAWDVDGSYDLYDARSGGGFPEPAPTQPCSGNNACQGPPSPAPSDEPQGSAFLLGDGNSPPAQPSDCAAAHKNLDRAKRKLRRADSAAERRKAKKAVRKAKRQLKECKGAGS